MVHETEPHEPAEAVQAAKDLRAKKILIVHWGTFRLGNEPVHVPPGMFSVSFKRPTWRTGYWTFAMAGRSIIEISEGRRRAMNHREYGTVFSAARAFIILALFLCHFAADSDAGEKPSLANPIINPVFASPCSANGTCRQLDPVPMWTLPNAGNSKGFPVCVATFRDLWERWSFERGL